MKIPDFSKKLKITIGTQTVTGTINDTEAGRGFAALLPITLTLSDYSKTEKVSDLLQKLDSNGAPSGYKPSAGDITYYDPWGNLAIFYKDFVYSQGLVSIGKIDDNLSALLNNQPFEATFELTD